MVVPATLRQTDTRIAKAKPILHLLSVLFVVLEIVYEDFC